MAKWYSVVCASTCLELWESGILGARSVVHLNSTGKEAALLASDPDLLFPRVAFHLAVHLYPFK